MSVWTDEMILWALALRDHEGLSAAQAAMRLGVTRSSVLGIYKRIADDELPCSCRKPENRDGGMTKDWGRRIRRRPGGPSWGPS